MNFSEKAKQIIAAIAPTAGAMFGGPLGGLAGNIIAQKLGADQTANPEKAVEEMVLGQQPEIVAQLRQAELDLQKHLADNDIDLERIAAEDRASARAREIAVQDHTPAILAYSVTVGFFATLGFLLWHGKPEAGGDALLVMLGALGGAWAAIVSYYFGSSAGSKDKTAALARFAKG
jgi:hypothetical protein